MPTTVRIPSRRTLLGAVAVLTVLALSACSGSSTTSDTSSTAAPGAGGATDFAAYRSCMADNGVTLPDLGTPPSGAPSGVPSGAPGAAPSGMPSGGLGVGGFPGGLPDGVDQATYDAAMAACGDLAPQQGPGAAGRPQIDASALAAYASCLADHDVTIPEGDGGMVTLDRTDVTVKAAMDTCAPLLPVPTASPAASPATS